MESRDGVQTCALPIYKRICFRVLQSTGILDPHFPKNIAHIKKANLINNVTLDVYAIPSIKVNVTKQVTIVKDAIKGLKIGYLWIQVENGALWNSDHAANQALLKALAGGFAKLGPKVGIQTNEQNWHRIMGREFSEYSNYPLWYVRADGRDRKSVV